MFPKLRESESFPKSTKQVIYLYLLHKKAGFERYYNTVNQFIKRVRIVKM